VLLIGDVDLRGFSDGVRLRLIAMRALHASDRTAVADRLNTCPHHLEKGANITARLLAHRSANGKDNFERFRSSVHRVSETIVHFRGCRSQPDPLLDE